MSLYPSVTTPKKLTDFRHLNLYSVDLGTRDGPSTWIFASRKSAPHEGAMQADAAVIIAIISGREEPRLVVTREYRAPLGRYEISVPSGLIDKGETVATAAARELREETGLELVRVHHISPPIASSAGMTDETVSLVYVEASGTTSRAYQTEYEDIEARLLTLTDVRTLLRQPGADVISSRLYPVLLGYVTAGAITPPIEI